MQNTWSSYLDSRSQVKGFTLEFRFHSISPEPLRRYSFNFTQMFLSMRWCAEPITVLHRHKIKVILQGHMIYPSIVVRSISPESFERFSLNFTQFFLSVRRRAEHLTQLTWLKVKDTGQKQGIYLWIPVSAPYWRFSLNFTQMFLSVRRCA